MIDVKSLKEELKKYNNKDLLIRIDGSLKLSLNIYKAECFVSKKVIVISSLDDKTNEEIEISIDEINSIEINSEISLQMNRKL